MPIFNKVFVNQRKNPQGELDMNVFFHMYYLRLFKGYEGD